MSGFNFGQQANSGQQTPSLFGTAGSQQNKSLFGGSSTPSQGQSGGGPFGGSTTPATGNMFGQPQNNSTTPAASGGEQQKPLFGAIGGGQEPGKSLFGNAGSGASTPSLFGQQNKTAEPSKLFGGTGTGASTPNSLFGGGNQPQTSGTEQGKSLFGGATSASGTNTPSMFGSGAGGGNTGGWSFGNASKKPEEQDKAGTPSSEQPKTGGGLFGGANTTSNALFGATGGSSSSNLFGQKPSPGDQTGQPATSTEQPKSLFGGGAAAPAPSSGGGMFQNLGSNQGSGATTPQPQKTSGLSFSTTPAGNPPSSSIFGGNKAGDENKAPAATSNAPAQGSQEQPKSLFGAPPASQPQSSSNLFGGAGGASTPNTQAQGTSSLFSGVGGSNSSIFNKDNSQQQQTPTSNLFGAPGANKDKDQTSTTQPPTSAATPGLFSGVGNKDPTAGGATSNPLFGAKKDDAATTTSSQPATAGTAGSAFGGGLFGKKDNTAASSAATSQPATTAGTGAPSLFGASAAAPSQQPANDSAKPTSAAAGAPAGLGASTATQPTSRLGAKSMDDILTTWSTSLATHQKTFSRLADRVSTWDRALVDNGQQISTLYGRCFQAERDVAEVERQLANVEHGQTELEVNLDRWEREVDGLLASRDLGVEGEGDLVGVNLERERMYKTAESCAHRLTEMSASLTDMIDEINSASTKLNTTKSATNGSGSSDDPLAQIVRVLNGHLAQLQTIDSGAAALQTKVGAAQREVRDLGGSRNGGGGLGGGSGFGASAWAEDFGRSYLGRR